MDVQIREEEDAVFYCLSGKVCTLSDYKTLYDLFYTVKRKNVVLDLTETTFISTQGFGTFVSLNDIVSKTGNTLFIFNPNSQIMTTLELAGISKIIQIAFTGDELHKLLASPENSL